jgi:hypothetical protein
MKCANYVETLLLLKCQFIAVNGHINIAGNKIGGNVAGSITIIASYPW